MRAPRVAERLLRAPRRRCRAAPACAPSARSVGQAGQQQVEALLPGQPADDAEQAAPSASASRPKPACSAALFAAASARLCRVERRRDARVGRRIPDVGIDAVEDARQHAGARAQQPVEAHAVFGRADFRRVGRRHRGDAVGELQPGLEKADRCREYSTPSMAIGAAAAGRASAAARAGTGPERRGCARSSPCAGRGAAGDSADRPAPAPPASHARARHRDDSPADAPRAISARDPRQRREAQRIVRPVPPVRPEIGIAAAGRTDAARRARADRARRRCRASSRAGPPNRSRSVQHRFGLGRAPPITAG